MKALLFFLSIVLLCCFSLMAQDLEEDPLNKPEIWLRLVKTPSDFTIWNEYMGKDWGEMNMDEKKKVIAWRRQLLAGKPFAKKQVQSAENQKVSDTKDVTGINQKEVEEVKKIEQEIIRVQSIKTTELRAMQTIMLEEEQEIASLKGNIASNFIMIEDLYMDIFQELGETYQPYEEAHPDGKYSKTKWIEEQEAKIKTIKLKRYQDLRSRIKVTDN